MLGVLLVSHGNMAEGMIDSVKMFFWPDLEQIDFLSLKLDMAIDDFKEALTMKLSSLDQGDGVVILTDLLGGTPANQCFKLIRNDINVFAGMNLAMLVELLNQRMCSAMDLQKLMAAAKDGVVCLNDISTQEASEDFFQ